MAGASTVLATLAVLATLIPKGPPAFTQAHTTHNDGSPQPLRHHALRGGGDEHGTVRAADHQLLGKRERAASRSPAGVSFQAVVDSEDAVRFFSAADLDTLRRQFVPLPTRTGAGGEGFWKNAKSSPILNVDKEAQLSQMAQDLADASLKVSALALW